MSTNVGDGITFNNPDFSTPSPELLCNQKNLLALNNSDLQLGTAHSLRLQSNGQLNFQSDGQINAQGALSLCTGAIPSERLRINADGSVGIGKIPGTGVTLDVAGALNATSIALNGVTLVSSQWTNIAGGINFASGKVGIGVSTPTQALEVNGAIKATNFFKGANPLVSSQWIDILGGISYTGGSIAIGTLTPDAYKLKVEGGDTYLGGALAIGGAVDIASNLTLTTGEIYFQNQLAAIHYGNRGKFGQATAFNPDNDANGLWVEGTHDGESGGIFMNGSTLCLWSPGDNDLMRVYDEDDFLTPKFVINANGNIGIGTPTPSHLFHVKAQDAVGLFESSGTQAYLRLSTQEGLGNRVEITNRPGGRLSLWTAGGGDMFNVTKDGNVGIGTITPTHRFHVLAPDAVGLFESSGTQAYLRLSTNEGLGNRVEITNRPGGRLTLWTAAGGDVLSISRDGQIFLGNNKTGPFVRLNDDVWFSDPQNGTIQVRNGNNSNWVLK